MQNIDGKKRPKGSKERIWEIHVFLKEGIGKWLCKHLPNSKGVAASLSTKLQDTLDTLPESNSEFTPENQ